MKNLSLNNFGDGMVNVINHPITKVVTISAISVFAIYLSGKLMMMFAGVVRAFKHLQCAIVQPVTAVKAK